jgi:hypothetical protein
MDEIGRESKRKGTYECHAGFPAVVHANCLYDVAIVGRERIRKEFGAGSDIVVLFFFNRDEKVRRRVMR